MTHNGPLLLGHRGYPVRYPENTLASLLAAIFYGADGVELDVWVSGDARLVIIHDRTTQRVAGKDTDVTKTPYSRLTGTVLGKGQTLISLEEVLESYPRERALMIEIKDPRAVEPTYRLIREHRDLENTFVVSFDASSLARMHRIDPDVKIGMNFDDMDKAIIGNALQEKYGLSFLGFPITALAQLPRREAERLVKSIRERGLWTMFWSPLELSYNPDFLFEKYLDMVDIAVVNDPPRVRRVMEKAANGSNRWVEDGYK